jgi:hypothetical protein
VGGGAGFGLGQPVLQGDDSAWWDIEALLCGLTQEFEGDRIQDINVVHVRHFHHVRDGEE